MKKRFIKAIVLFFTLLKTLNCTDLKLELIDVQNLAMENEKTPQPTVFVGTPFKLKLVVSGVDRNTGNVTVQGMDKLEVQGKSQQTSVSAINGVFTAQNIFFFDVFAKGEGPIQVGPAEVTQNGKTIKSNTVQFRAINQPQDPSKIKTATGEKLEVAAQGQEIVCELLTDKKSVFVGEPFIVTLKITVNDQIAELRMEPINFQGLSSREIDQPQRRQELKANKLTEIVEKKFAVTALQPGAKTVSPAKVIYQIPVKAKRNHGGFFGDDFFSGIFNQMQLQQKQALSNGLQLEAKPLPATTEFVDGIGKFKTYTMGVDKTSALTNEAIALTLQVDGIGNFEQISTPKLALPEFIKNYESKSEYTPNQTLGDFGGSKKFEYVIQVPTAGAITIPAQKFVYFDTDSKTYKTLQTNEINLQITQPAGEQQQQYSPETPSQPTKSKTPKQISKDIGFIEEEINAGKTSGWQFPFWIFLILFLSPLIIIFNLHKKLLDYCKTSKTFKLFSKKTTLSKFQSDFEILKNNGQAEKIYALLLGLLSAKFDVDPALITSDLIEQRLLAFGWDNKRITEFSDYLNECASLHFITTKQKPDQAETSNLFKKGSYWIVLLTNKNS